MDRGARAAGAGRADGVVGAGARRRSARGGTGFARAGFASDFDIRDFCSAPLSGSDVSGRVFILGPGPFAPDVLPLTEIVDQPKKSEINVGAVTLIWLPFIATADGKSQPAY